MPKIGSAGHVSAVPFLEQTSSVCELRERTIYPDVSGYLRTMISTTPRERFDGRACSSLILSLLLNPWFQPSRLSTQINFTERLLLLLLLIIIINLVYHRLRCTRVLCRPIGPRPSLTQPRRRLRNRARIGVEGVATPLTNSHPYKACRRRKGLAPSSLCPRFKELQSICLFAIIL